MCEIMRNCFGKEFNIRMKNAMHELCTVGFIHGKNIVAVTTKSLIFAFSFITFDGSMLIYAILTAYFELRKYDTGV